MKMNAGAWIGMIGGIAGLLIGLIAVLTTTGSSGIYIATSMLLVFGGMGYLFYKLLFGPMLLASRLKKTGLSGKAVIKEIHDTGVTINNNPQVKIVLDVKNSFGQGYTTTIRTIVSRIQPNLYQRGMTVPVLIDPKNENNVIIDVSGETKIPEMRPHSQDQIVLLQNELKEMQAKDDVIRNTGSSAKAIVKKYQWLGVNVNGNNPYAELEIEVLPADSPAFNGKVKGVISEQSISRYQPGNEIFVKYDPKDLRKVVIDHS